MMAFIGKKNPTIPGIFIYTCNYTCIMVIQSDTIAFILTQI